MGRPKNPNSVRSLREAEKQAKQAELAKMQELERLKREAETAKAEAAAAKAEAEAAKNALNETRNDTVLSENDTRSAKHYGEKIAAEMPKNSDFVQNYDTNNVGNTNQFHNNSDADEDELLSKLRNVIHKDKMPNDSGTVITESVLDNAAPDAKSTENETNEQPAADYSESFHQEPNGKGNPFSNTEQGDDGNVKFNLDGETLADWIMIALDGFNKTVLPPAYLSANFTIEERRIINRLKGKKAYKKGVLDDFTEAEIDLLSKWYAYEEYEVNAVLSETDKEILRIPLIATLKNTNVQLGPGWALVTAALIVMAPRILPIVMPYLSRWLDGKFGKASETAAPEPQATRPAETSETVEYEVINP
jgi:hypothetical protein